MGLFDWGKKKKDEEKPAPRPAVKPAARPKADFSNVQSGSSTVAAPAVGTPATPAGTTYEIKSGDTLWKIAEKHYGDGNQWRKIHEANKDEIKDPDKIYPGQKITLPKA